MITKSPHLNPTWEEFSNFSSYVEKMYEQYEKYGMVVITPPSGWSARSDYSRLPNIQVHNPVVQEFINGQAIITKPEKIWRLPNIHRNNKAIIDHDKFWNDFSTNSSELPKPISARNISMSLFNSKQQYWNLNNLPTLTAISEHHLPGITIPQVNIDTAGSILPVYCAPNSFYTINYQHLGRNKYWYCLNDSTQSDQFGNIIINPLTTSNLKNQNIDLVCGEQTEGDFVIIFPNKFYQTLSTSFVISEEIIFGMFPGLNLNEFYTVYNEYVNYPDISPEIFINNS